MSRARIMPGDVFAVPLPDRKWGYVHYLGMYPGEGPLIRALDKITDEPVLIDDLRDIPERFPPILANFRWEVKEGRWKFVGRMDVPAFDWPPFISGHMEDMNHPVHMWFLCDKSRDIRLGPSLPEQYRDLEMNMIYPAEDIAHRILHPEDRWWLKHEQRSES